MNGFLKYFYQDMGRIVKALWQVIVDFFEAINTIFNFPVRVKIMETYYGEFGTMDWVMMIAANLFVVVVLLVLLYLIGRFLKRALRFRIPVKEYDRMKEQVAQLTREVFKLNYEKDKILAMKVAEMGGGGGGNLEVPELEKVEETKEGEEGEEEKPEEEGEEYIPQNKRNTVDGPCINPDDSRFFRLTTVDNYYKTEYKEPEYDDEITLEELCNRDRLFAASRLGLYYDISTIRYFFAALGATKLIILQGISGTGKTSLVYQFGKFMQHDSTIASVQPAWRDKTELFGYFNEFTKKFNETNFLRAVYEVNYFKTPHVIVLDEMNIARVEYYFAEMLSVLEMPRSDEWLVDIVPNMWDNDPCLINGGKIHVAENTWFVGTINNDDSTFAVADKVYDRAIPIDLDSKAVPFEAPDTPPVNINYAHLKELFDDAVKKYPMSKENMDKLNEMEYYMIKHFRLAFGNRIMKQLKLFVPIYVACGGTEIDAVDFMIAKKILRKFESLSLGYMKDEMQKFIIYLDKNFGKQNMGICKEYITRLMKMSG